MHIGDLINAELPLYLIHRSKVRQGNKVKKNKLMTSYFSIGKKYDLKEKFYILKCLKILKILTRRTNNASPLLMCNELASKSFCSKLCLSLIY